MYAYRVKKREEKEETREVMRTTERKKEKNCILDVFGRTSDFNYYYRRT